MLTVGITGGIGSGKTTVCRIFEVLGIPVFYADAAARTVMETDLLLREKIIALLGPETYPNGVLNRQEISGKVFGFPEKLAALNALVHPATGRAWEAFQQAHASAPYLLKEAAILFESNAHVSVDTTVCVTAPENVRLHRAMQRDGADEAAIRSRMARQLPQAEKAARSDFEIVNDDRAAVLPQILRLDSVFRK